MRYESSASNHSEGDRLISDDQFNQVVDAILDGKYSWACVLMLQFAGHNPLHYMPRRTYNRLIHDQCTAPSGKITPHPARELFQQRQLGQYLATIDDLEPQEESISDRQIATCRGGYSSVWSLAWGRSLPVF